MLDFVVAGVPAAVVIVAIVQGLKRVLRIQGDAAIPVAVGVGVLVAVLAQVGAIVPAFGTWFNTVIGGVLLGLSACGLFDAGKAVLERFRPAE